ncbi:MAG: NAD(P)/FAD-dependent oxidoreductase [bacterium]
MTTFSIHVRKQPDDERSPEELLKSSLHHASFSNMHLIRESVDARKKDRVWQEYQLAFDADPGSPEICTALKDQTIRPMIPAPFEPPERDIEIRKNPLIIGFGPSGMFLGLQLARLGLAPIVLEQGEPIEQRWKSVQSLWKKGELNPQSNMHFGEGGAGTFSDGKLTAYKQSFLNRRILEEFYRAGGPEDILYKAKPHLGTDYLRKVVGNFRKEIQDSGGEVRFGHRFDDLRLEKGRVEGVVVNGEYHPLRQIFLCIGNSARSTFRMLFGKGVAMEAKPMAVGLRIEHPRDFIDTRQYGTWKSYLPAAEYKLTAQIRERGVYSFCMCPGGFIVCTATEAGGVVTNGMSYHSRKSPYSNSALVATVSSSDYPSKHPLSGFEFQHHLEQAAYSAPRVPFTAPVQRCSDFLKGQVSRGSIPCSYQPDVNPGDLGALLPCFLTQAIQEGLIQFEKKIRGFVERGVLVGVETRTSSPVRILRNVHCESINTGGLYVFGEGAGYAGGIMTSALDAYRFSLRVKGKRGCS